MAGSKCGDSWSCEMNYNTECDSCSCGSDCSCGSNCNC
uniref:Metallothionein class II n=1 Tax=Noccaea caerulescens TaxID=107243 RepID=A9UKL0_NOCCA|nr:metallothionein class II [Noccaea caerulescens]